MPAQSSITKPSTTVVVGMPLNDYPFVEPNRQLTFIWYNFLRALWQRVGGNVSQLISGAIDAVNKTLILTIGSASFVTLELSAAAGELAEVETPLGGAKALPQVLALSPFTFTAPFQGTLLVESGQVALQRTGMPTPIVCGLQGGALPVLTGDTIVVTWFNSPPAVVFLPGGSFP